MKIALFIIMCSGVAGQCLEPYKLNIHDNFYNCMISGYEEAIKKTKEIGQEEIDEHKIYIKFVCAPEEKNQKELDT
jgi:hypothetical protein